MATFEAQDITWFPVETSSTSAVAVKAATANKKVVLCGMWLVASGAVTVTIEDSDGTNLSGPMSFAANGGIVLPTNQQGYQVTASGKGLSILLGGAVAVAGAIGYRLIDG